MSAPEIRLVCFDLGGVVIRICRTWAEGCRAAGFEVRAAPQTLDRQFAANHDLIVAHQTGRLDAASYAARLSAALDGLYTPDEILAIHHAWLLGQYPGVPALIDRLRAAGLLTAALSNTNHAHWSRMDEFSAVGRLDHRFASHEIGHHKPDEASFRHVEATLGLRGGAVLFFDDSAENVAAARRLGWNAIRIDPLGDPAAQMSEALAAHGQAFVRS